jgi:hypothetical protein
MVVANDVRCARKSPPDEKDVNEPLGGIQQRDRYQQRDRLKALIVVASIIRVAPVSRSMALEPAEKQAAKEYLAPNCVPKDTVPFEVPHCLRRR